MILIMYLILFGLGVGNFGSGLRHRSKFVFEMILLIGPLIPTLIFKKKIKNQKLSHKKYNEDFTYNYRSGRWWCRINIIQNL